MLEGVTDADNVGSAFRNAAAFGADGVLLSPACCDPLYRKAIRTSMGNVLQMPYTRLDDWPGPGGTEDRGFTVVALTPRGRQSTSPTLRAAGLAAARACSSAAKAAGLTAGGRSTGRCARADSDEARRRFAEPRDGDGIALYQLSV